jgi:hypothetical protein
LAQIGILGDIVFEVSDDVVKTLENVKWSGSARYAEHERHLQNTLTEYTGIDADGMTFDIKLSAFLGVNPLEELGKIWSYERNGTAVPFVIGEKIYGKYRWTVKKHDAKFERYDKTGNVTSMDVSITLLEYINK